MKAWKKNVVAAGVLVTVCAGIYLNWLYTEEQKPVSLEDTLDSQRIMDDSVLVMSRDGAEPVGEELSAEDNTDYFSTIRLSRQEARDSAVSLLQEAMSYDTSTDGASVQQLDAMVSVALSEAQIESLVIAKGYRDCVAYMTEDGVSVAVAAPEEGLQQKDVALITDIVLTQSDYDLDAIRIVEVP